MYGVGKTTLARILAASENCLEPDNGEPCGKCSNCIDIFSGKSQDIIETNAAKERGIDDIRALSDRLRIAPINCKTRYVIFDESHSLGKQAVEALLKIIEEPPSNVRFVFCTTDIQAVIPTIVSRCQCLNFTKVSMTDISSNIKYICDKENINIEESSILLASRMANGSVRNSLQNLQKMVEYSNDEEKITEEIASKALGAISNNSFFIISQSILDKNVSKSMLTINLLMSEGKSSAYLLEGLSYHLRMIQLAKVCSSNLKYFDLTEEEIKKYEIYSSKFHLALIKEMIDRLYDVYRGMTLNMDLTLVLEKYLIECIIFVSKLSKN